MNKENLRYERKIYFPSQTKNSLRTMILLHPYGFKEIHYERQVNSLYYDNEDFCSFKDNADGSPNRAKIRLRWYGNKKNYEPGDNLEIKTKKGLVGYKIITSPEKIFETVPGLKIEDLKPVLKVSYDRSYYVSFDEKYRFTIDSNISYTNPSNNIAYNDDGCVLELKYDVSGEDSADKITKNIPVGIGKFSKYARGILYLYG